MAEVKETKLSRRFFVQGGSATAAALAVSNPFEAFAHWGRRRKGRGYGPLFETHDLNTGLPLIKLPKGFRYVSFGWTGDPMVNGDPTPPGHDGAAALWGPWGRIYYVRNHELRANPEGLTESFARRRLTYDKGQAPGGTTTVVFDARRGRYLRTVPSLSGTIRNCAGGPTPWNSWLTCEETLDEPGAARGDAELEQTHGWVFEVPALRRARPQPIKGMGRFVHEAAAVDPYTGIVYETEDRGESGIYRFVPKYYGALHYGGRQQALKVLGHPSLDTATGDIPVGSVFDVGWVDIADPERPHDTPGDGGGVFSQGFGQGAASFRRGEGMWYGNGKIYFVSTSGGAAGEGQIWALNPRRNKLKLVYESPSEEVLDNPDNIAISPRGGILLCEDGDLDGLYMRGLTPRGEIFDFAQNNIVLNGEVNGIAGDFRGREWAGASFSPDGRWLLVSIQTPGVTFAITGPWRRGAL